MDSFLNFSLMKNPYNWAIVLLMTALGAMALDLLFRSAGINNNG